MKRPARQCPTCGSTVRMDRGQVAKDRLVSEDAAIEPMTDLIRCLDSWHPAQAFPVPEDSNYITATCGSHCGVKDNMVGHCDCRDCHNGKRAEEGLKELDSTNGLSVKGVSPT